MSGAFCPRCGEARVAEFRFCRGCGLDLNDPNVTNVAWASPPPKPVPTGWVMPPPAPSRRVTPNLLQPVHLRDDLRHLPDLIFRGLSVLPPAAVAIVVFIAFEASGASIGNQSKQSVAFNLFVFPPPLLLPLVAGLLTTRASYLAGIAAAGQRPQDGDDCEHDQPTDDVDPARASACDQRGRQADHGQQPGHLGEGHPWIL